MPAPKIVELVSSCKKCPNRKYYSGGVHECTLTGDAILKEDEVAPFCPLPDYPSRTITAMQRTILDLREPNKVVFVQLVLSHIATKLGLNLEPEGRGIKIPFKDRDQDREVYIEYDSITESTILPFTVTFLYGGKKFKLSPDAEPRVLEEAMPKMKGLEDKELWASYRL